MTVNIILVNLILNFCRILEAPEITNYENLLNKHLTELSIEAENDSETKQMSNVNAPVENLEIVSQKENIPPNIRKLENV